VSDARALDAVRRMPERALARAADRRGDLTVSDVTTIERVPRGDLARLQVERLRALLERAARVPLHRERLAAAKVGPGDIRSLDDLRRLPFTTKADFRDTYPFGLLAVPMDRVVRIHASSGTTGKATVVAYTRGDLDVWTEVMARVLRAGGVGPGDIVQNAYGYGLFTGGLGFHYGAEAVGAAVIPVSGGFTERQLVAFQDLGSTVLCCTPSYALHLAETIGEAGLAIEKLRLRVGFFGAEPWTDGMRTAIEQRLRLMALNIYGLSEITGPGVAVECAERQGMHVAEDHFLPEIVDPNTLEPMPPGRTGELVLTTLSKEGMPLLRYRTRDLTTIDPAPSDDMLIIRGVNVYPSQVEHALLQISELAPHYVLIVRREHALDTLEVQVESQPGAVPSDEAAAGALAARVRHRLFEALGVSVAVGVVAPKTIERSVGKAKRVLDLRGQSV
jgi:phenylacetate-CoA ligase